MKQTTFQHPELRDENDNIIQQGAFGKNTALANSTNDGWIDYVANDLEALHDNINGARIYVANKAALPAKGDLSAMYIAEDTGKWYLWDGTKYIETDNARKIADEAIAARDAAKASQTAAKTFEQNAKTSENNAAASKAAAATSASAAKTSEQNAGTQANTAKAWATSTTSPDGAADTASTTGKTQSAKSWAMYSKDRATASASSASAAATSAGAAKTSETNAASSKTAAATSATNAANSAKAAAASANDAANSAREQQADWVVTDPTSKAFVKNKPEVLLKSGGTATGAIIAPSFQTGNDASHYFQCQKFRGEGTAETYYHAVDFGYADHNQVDFYEYGGVWNFNVCTSGNVKTASLVGSIQAGQGWNGLVKGQDITTYAKKSDLSSSVSTSSLTVTGETSVPTAHAGNSSKAIANTAYVQGELTNYLPLSGGSITGDVDITGDLFLSGATGYVNNGKVFAIGNTDPGNVDLGWNWANGEGAGLALRNTDYSSPGEFSLFARDSTNSCSLDGKPDGSLTWGNKEIATTVVGAVVAFAGSTLPTGWLLCDGSAVSRTDYAALYAVIGTTYGAGNGSTTFNLPNLVDKFVEGSATAGTVKSAGLPNITGTVQPILNRHAGAKPSMSGTGAFAENKTDDVNFGVYVDDLITDSNGCYEAKFDASRSSSVYGNSTTVQPPALTMRYIIKY